MNFTYNNQPFVPGETPIFYSGPNWDENELNAAIGSLTSGKWVSSGEKVHKFEREFSRIFHVNHSHMVNSGSSANLVLLAGIKEFYRWNDQSEIIISPVGFPTTIAPIFQNRLIPVFVDIEFDTLNFNIDMIEEKITDNTRAIFVSPVLGNPPDMDKLNDLANTYNLMLIGDNCDSLGSRWAGQYITESYFAWTTSFYPAHHITTGEGGMVCTNHEELNKIFISLSWWGRSCYCVGSANLLPEGTCKKRFSKWLDNYDCEIDHKYVFDHMGYNLKPLDLQGAIGLEQLKKWPEIEAKRKENKENISTIFYNHIPGIYEVHTLPLAQPSWFGVPLICHSKELKHRLVKYLETNKIQTRNYFAGNILLHPGYAFLDDYKKYPNAISVLDLVFFVGCAPNYTDAHIEYIRDVVRKFK